MSIENSERTPEQEFPVGKEVKVERSNKTIEEGWEVVRRIPATDAEPARVMVVNKDGVPKYPTLEKLREWNP